MSNTRNLHLILLGKFLNHDITTDKLRHCKRPDFLRISEFITSKSFLLTFPIFIQCHLSMTKNPLTFVQLRLFLFLYGIAVTWFFKL